MHHHAFGVARINQTTKVSKETDEKGPTIRIASVVFGKGLWVTLVCCLERMIPVNERWLFRVLFVKIRIRMLVHDLIQDVVILRCKRTVARMSEACIALDTNSSNHLSNGFN
jgi:hypothetical protein